MKTGSGKRNNYNQTTGSKTARLYSRKTANRINQIYQENEKHNNSYTNYGYYETQRRKNRKQKKESSTVFAVVSLIFVILALLVVALVLLRPSESSLVLVEPTDVMAGDTTGEETEETQQTNATAESAPPVIYGVMPIVVYQGHSVAYKSGIRVEDDTDTDPTLEVDNSEVDLSTPGKYLLSYVARDKDGNVTREFTTVTVLEGEDTISDEEIYALADSIIDSIITDDMTDEMKCLKVYEYLHAINYVDVVHSEDWMQNAYWMLQRRAGDCFCYYSAARLLLNRLGFDVMEVRNNNNFVHYWCLVSIDGGNSWWHFDACCWSWGEDGVLCLVSDNYLTEFTKRHMTSDGRLIHCWDRDNFPATPENDFWTEEDREVIYEDGLIDVDATYDESLWGNNSWDDYLADYYYEPSYYEYEEYYNYDENTGYEAGYTADPEIPSAEPEIPSENIPMDPEPANPPEADVPSDPWDGFIVEE